jgi:hypothetical protein
MNPARILCALIAMVVLLGVPLASPVNAQVRDPRLNDSTEPGSVIVFPKFVRGFVIVPGDGLQPKTEYEVGVVCPKGATCTEGQKVTIRFKYICGSSEANLAQSFVCKDTDAQFSTTINGKVVFNTEGVFPGNVLSPQPQCERGYLIGWVINDRGQPIKFDGLIGDAVIRETGTAVAAYTAIPIQADPFLATGALIGTAPGGNLFFDGLPGHYQAVTGVIYADVAFDRPPAAPATGPRTTLLTLLTLDVRANRPNLPTFVDLDFYNSGEQLLSTSTEFICWQEVSLSGINDGFGGVPLPSPFGAQFINTTLTGPNMGTRKGIVIAGPAEKVPIFNIDDTPGPVTLLGLVEVLEGASPTSGADRQFFYQFLNDSNPVPTTFFL